MKNFLQFTLMTAVVILKLFIPCIFNVTYFVLLYQTNRTGTCGSFNTTVRLCILRVHLVGLIKENQLRAVVFKIHYTAIHLMK
jgi:hypothetical protein